MNSLIPRTLLAVCCLATGAALAWTLFGRPAPERALLNQRLEEFRSCAPEVQLSVRKNYSDFKSLPESRQKELRAIHQETQKSPELASLAEEYFRWWSSLTRSEWSHFREMTDDQKLEFVRQNWERRSGGENGVVIEFEGPSNVKLQPLTLKYEDFWQCLSLVTPPENRSEQLNRELDGLKRNRHKALRLALAGFEEFESQQQPRHKMEERTQAFREAMLKSFSDEAWKKNFLEVSAQFRVQAWASTWHFLTLFRILDRATIALGEDLQKDFPVTQGQIIDAFAGLEGEEGKSWQDSLMLMSAEESRKQLQLLAQAKNSGSPEEELLQRYNQFTRKRQSYLRLPFRFGPPGSGPPGSGPPGDRKGSGRPQQPNGQR